MYDKIRVAASPKTVQISNKTVDMNNGNKGVVLGKEWLFKELEKPLYEVVENQYYIRCTLLYNGKLLVQVDAFARQCYTLLVTVIVFCKAVSFFLIIYFSSK